MKYFLYIVLILIIFVCGMNIGSNNNINKAEDIQNKIDYFENSLDENEITMSHNIQPNILNILGKKCNEQLDNLINNLLKKIIK